MLSWYNWFGNFIFNFFISSFFYNYYFQKNNLYIFIFGILVILTRIELFSLFLIFLFSNFFKEKKIILISLIIVLGLIFNFLGSYLINGYIFPETAISKLHTLTPSNTYNFSEIIDRLLKMLILEQSYFIGFKTKFFPYFINAFFTILFLIVLFKPILKIIIKMTRGHKITKSEDLIFSISAACITIPIAYIFSGQIWDWYFLPFAFFQ